MFNKIFFGEKSYILMIIKFFTCKAITYKTSAYVKYYDGQTKWMYFWIEDDDLLEKYNTTWDKVSADIKKDLIASLYTIKKF